MDIELLKTDLRRRLARGEGEVREVLDTLESHQDTLSEEQASELLNLQSRWSNHRSKSIKNTYYAGEAEVAFGRILDDILAFISKMGTAQHPKPPASLPKKKKTILFLAANPEQSSFLRLDREFREISESLRKAQKRDEFELELRLATQPSDLTNAVREHKPWIVHFAGHGGVSQADSTSIPKDQRAWNWDKANNGGEQTETSGGITLMDESSSKAQFVKTEVLAEYFSYFKESLACVFLNSCYSSIQAEAIHTHIPYVIGMENAVGDSLAIGFARAFYEGIFSGEEIKRAFEMARTYLNMLGEEGTEIPRILSRS